MLPKNRPEKVWIFRIWAKSGFYATGFFAFSGELFLGSAFRARFARKTGHFLGECTPRKSPPKNATTHTNHALRSKYWS